MKRIEATSGKMSAAIIMMKEPEARNPVTRLLRLSPGQYNHLYKMYLSGEITYNAVGGMVKLKVNRKEHPEIEKFDFKVLGESRHSLPNYTVQDFSEQTVGSFYENK